MSPAQAEREVRLATSDERNAHESLAAFRLTAEPRLSQIAFDVAEQIYWRLTGGLSNEKFATATDPRSAGKSRR